MGLIPTPSGRFTASSKGCGFIVLPKTKVALVPEQLPTLFEWPQERGDNPKPSACWKGLDIDCSKYDLKIRIKNKN